MHTQDALTIHTLQRTQSSQQTCEDYEEVSHHVKADTVLNSKCV